MKYPLFACILMTLITAHAAGVKTITIVYTGSLNGTIDYCTCKSSPKGGLVKRGTALRQLRTEHTDLFLFDTGDYLPSYIDEDIPPYIFRSYEYLAYDALAFGDQDIDPGISRFFDLGKNLPLVNSNIAFKKLKSQIPGYRIIQKGPLSVAVIALGDPNAYRFALMKTKNTIIVSDVVAAAKKTLASIPKGTVDLTVALVHGDLSCAREIDRSVEGIDLIICGHDSDYLQTPEKGNHAWIVHPGRYGARIGVIELSLSGGEVSLLSHTFIIPDSKKPEDDPYIRSLINEYRDKKE
jgi:2',3'-cyclic-nucleotide 2'-phosphodiesterase (5'-nucleotidase family)